MADTTNTAPARIITAARVHRWIDTKTLTPMFGVQVKADGKWHHIAVDRVASLFPTEAAARASADEIMRQVSA